MGDEFLQYERLVTTGELRPYVPGEDLTGKSVDPGYVPKLGDWVARNPKNRDQQWVVSSEYFDQNYKPEPMGNLGVQQPIGDMAAVGYADAATAAVTEEETAYKRTGTNTRESLLRGPRGSEF